MPQDSLDAIFSPRSIAVIGASDRRDSVGGAVLANLLAGPFAGPVWVVNPRHPLVQGQRTFAAIGDLPATPDLAVVCTSAELVPDLVAACGRRGVGGLIVISAGFREVGPAGAALEARLRQVLRDFPAMRMIGPNCLGVLRPALRLNASFSPVLPRPGRLTLITQSGALGTAIMDWSTERDIGFAACVSVGNMVNVGIAALLDYFRDDRDTDAILLYLEGLDSAAGFVESARACSQRKPVLVFKAGRFDQSSRAAASHTGAIASQDSVYEAAFRRAGIERVHSIEELFDCARLLSRPHRALGNRLAIVTNAGGPGIMASDAWIAFRGELASLADSTLARLDRVLPSCWSHGNPIDVLGDATVDRYEAALDAALSDPGVDALMVIVTPQTMTQADRIAEAVVRAQQVTSKTIVAAWIGGPSVEAGRAVLRQGGIPVYDFPDAAAGALHHLVAAGDRRSRQPASQTWSFRTDEALGQRAARWRIQLQQNPGLLDEVRSKELLADYGLPVVPTARAESADQAVELANEIGYPVVLKVLSPDISHKTDVGGVVLNLGTEDAVRSGYETIRQSVAKMCPTARWQGVSVQPMVAPTRGVELLLGMKRDPLFGPVLLIGAGGITAELQKDSALELTPLDDEAWEHMLRSLRLYPLLEGYRGRPGIDLKQLRDVVGRFVNLVTELPELSVAEINPLLATRESLTAIDARLIAESGTRTA